MSNSIAQQLVSQIPWGHNLVILDKIQAPVKKLWYAQMTLQHEWSQPVLVHQIVPCGRPK